MGKEELERKLNESMALNRSLERYRVESEKDLLRDIGNALRAEYEDFRDSIRDEMDLQLGEIYREKLKSIFRILEGKGITL